MNNKEQKYMNTFRSNDLIEEFLVRVSDRFGGCGKSAATRAILLSAKKRYDSQDRHNQELDLFPI
jgi:hypothetical protein